MLAEVILVIFLVWLKWIIVDFLRSQYKKSTTTRWSDIDATWTYSLDNPERDKLHITRTVEKRHGWVNRTERERKIFSVENPGSIPMMPCRTLDKILRSTLLQFIQPYDWVTCYVFMWWDKLHAMCFRLQMEFSINSTQNYRRTTVGITNTLYQYSHIALPIGGYSLYL